MQGYRYKIAYKKGSTLTAADCLSRLLRPDDYVPPIENDPLSDSAVYAVSTDLNSRTIIQFDTDTGETDFDHITAVGCPASLPTLDELKTELQNCADFLDIYR